MEANTMYQNWKQTTRKYDATKTIAHHDLEELKKAIDLSITSFGIKPYKVIIIQDHKLRQKLKAATWGQSQITDASHLFIFASLSHFKDYEIDTHMNEISQISSENLTEKSNLIKSKIAAMSNKELKRWTSQQIHLAVNNLLSIAAQLNIDATPTERFESERLNTTLGLNTVGLNANTLVAVGYKALDTTMQHPIAMKKTSQRLFITL